MAKNLLIVHGGGPTAVINCSLYGAIREAQDSGKVQKILGAVGGTGGVIQEDFYDFTSYKDAELSALLHTPASALGTSRYPLEAPEYEQMAAVAKRHDIGMILFNGGNGTMEACGRLNEVCAPLGISVVGIPKTIDNDIAATDHAPGYGSAARYIAWTTREVGEDVRSLPIHVSIIEAMGRNVGWITAASALAREQVGDAPHLIYPPERSFVEDEFLANVSALSKKIGGVVVVASEGLRNEQGKPIVPPIFQTGRSVYYGDVSAYLAELVIKKLGIKARSEKPGLAGRASIALQSRVDREEAIVAGKQAARAAIDGKTGLMIGFKRVAGAKYQADTIEIPIQDVMLTERKLPADFMNSDWNDVTPAFVKWCNPLIGEKLPSYFHIAGDQR